MLWVGGSIILHGLDVLGMSLPYDTIHHIAVALANGSGFVEWAITAFLDGVVGIALGMLLIPVVTRVLSPLSAAITGKEKAPH